MFLGNVNAGRNGIDDLKRRRGFEVNDIRSRGADEEPQWERRWTGCGLFFHANHPQQIIHRLRLLRRVVVEQQRKLTVRRFYDVEFARLAQLRVQVEESIKVLV